MVSIIMPIYNGQKTMHTAIESVLNQSYKDIQLIIVDDGSTDQSLEIIQKYAESDSRIVYVSQNNRGVAAARNIGFKYAHGDFVLFVDCDDSLELSAVEELVTRIESTPRASFVLFGFNVYEEENLLRTPNPGDGYYAPGDGYHAFLTIEKLMASSCNKLYRRDYIKHMFDESLVFGEDRVFNYSNFKADTEVLLCSKCLYNVQLGTGNSVNKRYKHGKLLNMLYGRALKEQVCTELFQEEFDKDAFRINELSTVAFMVYTCCTKLNSKEAIQELENTIMKSEYLNMLLAEVQSARMRDKLLLLPLEHKKYSSVLFRSKLLQLLRRGVRR